MQRSQPPETPWTRNWRLIRNLWPDWNPTPDMIKEVWFRTFDKPHGNGPGHIDHSMLTEAIRNYAMQAKGNTPRMFDLMDHYHRVRRQEFEIKQRSQQMIELEHERHMVERQHVRFLSEMSGWSAERLTSAREFVARACSAFGAEKSSDISTWSRTYTGLVWAADQIQGDPNAKQSE